MNTAPLKKYAPAARSAFIEAVKAQAAKVGVTAAGTSSATIQGDVLLIDGQALPKSIATARRKLAERVRADGYEHTMEAIAYTWFNRLAAIRYMELHGYLDHGYRVLSNPDGSARPEVLDHATDVALSGLDQSAVVELKLDGTKDEELYRLVLKAQCNALHEAMPFLFDPIGSETELLLPANLLHTDSLIREMVESIDEELWQEIEITGWLYQFYISEKKDQVIGKVVKSEDIPAATQLFTPNWIVKYLVQNSLGAQWLATYPDSALKEQMEYYIEPAEQTAEVNAQLAEITPSQLNPEELTLIDPACGSGHILVEAYDLFKAIYLERGYRQRDVPRLILKKNLFGLDIDQRAAQLTGFALMMKGRADDRRLFERGVKLNVMALVDSGGFDSELVIARQLGAQRASLVPRQDLFPETLHQRSLPATGQDMELAEVLRELKRLFEHATTFGSLIQVPEGLAAKLPALKKLSEATCQDLFVSEALERLGPLVQQAELLAAQYEAVVANPPYMGSKAMNPLIKEFAKDHFSGAKSDLFACFVERGFTLAECTGYHAMVTMHSWMFLSSLEQMRERLLQERTIHTMVHMSNGVMGIAFGTAATILRNYVVDNYLADYSYIAPNDLNAQSVPSEFPVRNNRLKQVAQVEFKKIPGSPVAYWVSDTIRKCFDAKRFVGTVAPVKQGLATSDNARFVRYWPEIARNYFHTEARSLDDTAGYQKKWYPHNKGGEYRKWFGNHHYVVNWGNNGEELWEFTATLNQGSNVRLKSREFYFKPSASWSDVTSGDVSARFMPPGFIFDTTGPSIFEDECFGIQFYLGLLNSVVCGYFVELMNPTMHFTLRDANNFPLPDNAGTAVIDKVGSELVQFSKLDWNAYERSWEFQSLPLLTASTDPTLTLESSYTAWITQNRDTIAEMKHLEEENNRLFIDAYGLADELTPDVPIEQITLTVNPAYRYRGKLTEEEQWTRFRQDTIEELVSYAIGCMMGRYSLDEPGLIYAHSGNDGFDASKYATFPADDDGIVPLTDTEWFADDACNRFVEFLSVTWRPQDLEENLEFVAVNLGPKKSESSRETIRRWLCDKFFKDHHLKRYKKRPIYWLFSSGKQKAFRCLVYLHRYNEGTLARMRSEYVIPLQGKIAARTAKLKGDVDASTSSAERKRLQKEQTKLEKQEAELLAFDEKLRHFADRRIALDLDDGVKVNYGKFGDLLAEVKSVHGKKPEVA